MEKRYRGEEAAERAIKKGMANALQLVGADLTGKAQRQAPKDKGFLRQSGKWDVKGEASFLASGGSYDSIEVSITFDVPYAAVQHENETFEHRYGKAKYLADPMRSNALAYKPLIARAIKQEIARRL